MFDESLNAFTTALQINPQLPDAIEGKFKSILGKANIYLIKSDYQTSLKLFNDCDELYPDNPEVKQGKISSLIGIGKNT